MKKRFFSLLALAGLMATSATAAPKIPDNIQDGNILHCFNWTFNDIVAELPNIAAAGFGAIQVSPVQGNCATNAEWFYAYMPYDFAFKANGNGSRAQLKTLCEKAATYNIKIVVDVVANHVNQANGYHDTWWDSNGRVRWNGGVDYGNRYSITHNQLGEYGDVNSEDAQVQARAKAFIEDLKSLGVKGIRWDAAKHIGLPSESCNFWPTVASVAGMWHYGEILDTPGGDKYKLLKEYTNSIGVSDSEYSKWTLEQVCKGNVPTGHGSWTANGVPANKVVYWAESHDDYSNDGQYGTNTSQIAQDKMDRAYAITACRNNETALYFSRPSKTRRVEIKMGQKGSTHFTTKEVAEVNKFRNAMVGRKDYFSQSNGVVCVTRENGGAVIVIGAGGSRQVSCQNGGGYVPAGTYKDQVSGNTFTVTATTISGQVGSTGIAVVYNPDNVGPNPNPNPNPGPDPIVPDPDPASSLWILGNLEGAAGWATTPGTGVAMTANGNTFTAKGVKFVAAAGETTCYFNLTDYVGTTWDDLNEKANRYGAATEGEALTAGKAATIVKYANNVDAMGCLSWTIPAGTYDVTADLSTMKITLTGQGSNPDPIVPDPIVPDNDKYYVYFNNTQNWTVKVWAWNDKENCCANSEWPGDGMTSKDGKLYWEAPAGKVPTMIIFSNNGGDKAGGDDLEFVNGATYNPDGTHTIGDNPNPGPNPGSDVVTITGDYNLAYSGTKANVHYWGGVESTWPGVAMTTVKGSDGKTYKVAKVTEGTTGCLFNTNGDSDKTGDLTYTSEYVMDDNGPTKVKVKFVNGENPGPNPGPEPADMPSQLWILGNLSGMQWTTDAGVEMTKKGSTFVAEDVVFELPDNKATDCYFNLTDALGADWDELNQAANRYGAAAEGATITVGNSAAMKAYLNNVDAMGCLSWMVAPGTYTVIADFENMTVTVTDKVGGVDAIEGEDNAEAEYYNLQGVRVAEPTSGLYIVRRGSKVTKEIVR